MLIFQFKLRNRVRSQRDGSKSTLESKNGFVIKNSTYFSWCPPHLQRHPWWPSLWGPTWLSPALKHSRITSFCPRILHTHVHLFYLTSQNRWAFLLQWVLSRTPVVEWWLVWSQQCATELSERGRSPGWSLLLQETAWDGHTDGRSWYISSTKGEQWVLWFHRHWPLWTITLVVTVTLITLSLNKMRKV